MLNNKAAATAPEAAPAQRQDQGAGHEAGMTGTPTIFFTDGSRIPGAIDAKGLEAKLESIK